MEYVGLESFEETTHIYQHTVLIDELTKMHDRIALEGMSKDDAVLLERMVPGIFEELNINRFTLHPSDTGKSLALEGLDYRRAGIMAAAALAIVAVIGKIIAWLGSSVSAVGDNSGGIKDVSKTNASIARRCTDNVTSDLVSEDSLEKIARNAVAKIRGINTVNSNYLNVLIKDLDSSKITDSHGKQIAPDKVIDAANKYVAAIKGTRASDNDNELHALLGYMLNSKQGGIPLVLRNINWSGGSRRDRCVDEALIMSVNASLTHASRALDSVVEMIAAISGTKHSRLSVVTAERFGVKGDVIDGKQGDAPRLYAAMKNANAALTDIRNNLEQNASLREVYSNDTVTTFANAGRGAMVLKVIPKFDKSVLELFTRVRDDNKAYISLWNESTYQNYSEMVEPSKNYEVIRQLASPSGRDELGALYKSVYEVKGDTATAHMEKSIDFTKSRLDDAQSKMSTIIKMSKLEENGWLRMDFYIDEGKGDNPMHSTSFKPLSVINGMLETAQGFMNTTSQITSIVNMVIAQADRSIKITERMK